MNTDSQVVLYASALIARIYEESGAQVVERHLARALVSTGNLSEVATYMVRRGSDAEEVSELLKELALETAVFDEEQALLAADLIRKTAPKGLSFGDRACLALAWTRELSAFTADKEWGSLAADVQVAIESYLLETAPPPKHGRERIPGEGRR